MELLDLYVGGELGTALRGVDQGGESSPHAVVIVGIRALLQRTLHRCVEATGRHSAHVPRDEVAASSSIWRWIEEYTDRRGGGRRREAKRLPMRPPATRAITTAVMTVPRVSPPLSGSDRLIVFCTVSPRSVVTPVSNVVLSGRAFTTWAVTPNARCPPPVVTTTPDPATSR